jgi:hypothetical protein
MAGSIEVAARNNRTILTVTVTMGGTAVLRDHSNTKRPERNRTGATWRNIGKDAMISGTRHASKPRRRKSRMRNDFFHGGIHGTITCRVC